MNRFEKIGIILFLAHFIPEYPCLEHKPLSPFTIVSAPEDNEVESIDSFNGGFPYVVNPDAVQVRTHEPPQENNGKGRIATSKVPEYMPGIRRKLNPEKISETFGVQITAKGSAGVEEPTTSATESSHEISWDKAFSQSVKKVVVHQPYNVHGGKQVGRFVSIVSNPGSTTTTTPVPSPPPHEQVARMARFIVHNSDWSSLATTSTRSPTNGFPFANIFSVSDGPPGGNSTGTPYMYMTPLDISVIDLKRNARSSMTMSLAQGSYCKSHNFDPEDPRCARVILTGNIKKVLNNTAEAETAKNALFLRHPDMASWPADHGWFFAKLEIAHILVLDYFGGAKSVSPSDYFAANP